MNNSRKSEAALLEQYRVALENVKNQPEIASEMEELNYNKDKISEGEQLLAETRAAYDFKKQEDDETTEASTAFKKEKEQLDILYRKHRKKAKVVFRKQPETLKKIGVVGTTPRAYTNWIETTRRFYNQTDQNIIDQLATIKITPKDITSGNMQIQEVENARAKYLKEVGESEDATKQKDAAFAKMEDWMRDFYAVADIALEDQPQLMEALGRKRKS
ncbi:hypothetical protein ATO12_19580 [Aquimarina atlantica]|uniref:Uncharacterized protein n=1 Tax=Aquimarina atlantica TaxID=1317122 RepID=A0A023BT70_9FLAO|nr:hypothetical protein [Aquimarina atlantica]EZH73207.1 hypothetical protein ATO12_19580 [Aquimarina atlantica]